MDGYIQQVKKIGQIYLSIATTDLYPSIIIIGNYYVKLLKLWWTDIFNWRNIQWLSLNAIERR